MLGKYKNIAISGQIGTGKSTLAKNLAEKLGWKFISTGELVRKWHEENHVPVNESGKVPEEMDRQIEADRKKMMENEDDVVFEAHLAGWIAKDLPKTFKVLCVADDETRIKRTASREGVSYEQAKKDMLERAQSHQDKFKKLYDIDNRFDPSYFNLIVDTTNMTPEHILGHVLEKMKD